MDDELSKRLLEAYRLIRGSDCPVTNMAGAIVYLHDKLRDLLLDSFIRNISCNRLEVRLDRGKVVLRCFDTDIEFLSKENIAKHEYRLIDVVDVDVKVVNDDCIEFNRELSIALPRLGLRTSRLCIDKGLLDDHKLREVYEALRRELHLGGMTRPGLRVGLTIAEGEPQIYISLRKVEGEDKIKVASFYPNIARLYRKLCDHNAGGGKCVLDRLINTVVIVRGSSGLISSFFRRRELAVVVRVLPRQPRVGVKNFIKVYNHIVNDTGLRRIFKHLTILGGEVYAQLILNIHVAGSGHERIILREPELLMTDREPRGKGFAKLLKHLCLRILAESRGSGECSERIQKYVEDTAQELRADPQNPEDFCEKLSREHEARPPSSTRLPVFPSC